MYKINFNPKYSRIIDDLSGSIIIDQERQYDIDRMIYLIQLPSGEKLAMCAVHYIDGSNEINFYDLIEVQNEQNTTIA